VLSRNPEIAAAQSAWQAALARVPQAGALDDPMASYSIAPLSIGSSDATFGQELRLSQPFPFPGKRALRREVARAEAAASERNLAEVRLRLATMAAVLYDELWLLDRRRDVAHEHLRLLATLQEVAAARYAAGLAPQQAPLQAEVEAARVEQQVVQIDAERLRAVAQVNALLHRAPGASLPPPEQQLEPPQSEAVAPEATPAGELAHPHLQARQAEVEARRAGLELARRAYQPDLELMTSYSTMWDMEEHRWMVGVGVNVPIWRQRRQAAVSEAEAQLATTEAELATFEDHIRQEIASARASVDETAALLRLYRDRVLPAARDQLAAARASFQSGAADMVGVIEAERGLRSAQVDYYATLAAHASRRSELESALGRFVSTPQPAHAAHPASPASSGPEVNP
jgi:outer membrane protein TolC